MQKVFRDYFFNSITWAQSTMASIHRGLNQVGSIPHGLSSPGLSPPGLNPPGLNPPRTMCLRAIGVAEGKLRAAAAAAAAAPATAPGHLVEALKPSVLTLDATPIEVRQWKKKLVTYLCRSGVPPT